MFDRVRIRRLLFALFAVCLAGCWPAWAGDDNDDYDDEYGSHRPAPELVQPGERLVLLGVTSDNYALVQDGQTVYASELKRGARQQIVGTSPLGVVAFVYTVGKVAFVWTQPNRSLPGFGVSPLTVWSAATGATAAAEQSPIGTFTTSASEDGRHVMYTTRGTPDGSVGDIEFARTDMSQRTTLVAGVPMAFPGGPCRPWGSFVGNGHRSHPVALFCEGGATTATLASWSSAGIARSTLLTDVLTQPFFRVSPDGRQFFTALAGSRTPVVVNDRGDVRRLEEGVLSRQGFFTTNSDVYYTARGSQSHTTEIHRASLRTGGTAFVVDNVVAIHTVQTGSDLIVTPPSSPDGRKLAYATGQDPVTGLLDFRIADLVNAGSRAPEPARVTTLSGPVFSADSKYALYARIDDVSTGNAQLIAAGPHGNFALGAPSLWSHDRLKGARIVFNDNVVYDATDFFRSTADLKMVNLSRPTQSLSIIEAQAYLAYFPSKGGREMAYTTGRGRSGPGLYVAKGRAQRDGD